MKSTLFEMKTIVNKRNGTIDSGEKIGELEEIIMEAIKNEIQWEKKIIIKKLTEHQWNRIISSESYMWTVVPNGKEVKLLEKVKAKHLQSWWKPHTQMQEAWQSLSTKNRGTTPRRIIIRLLKSSDNKKTLKSIKRKNVWLIQIMIAISHWWQSKQEDSGVTSLKHRKKNKNLFT